MDMSRCVCCMKASELRTLTVKLISKQRESESRLNWYIAHYLETVSRTPTVFDGAHKRLHHSRTAPDLTRRSRDERPR